jgi:hypothetical protein
VRRDDAGMERGPPTPAPLHQASALEEVPHRTRRGPAQVRVPQP